jgi:hypothetical protein
MTPSLNCLFFGITDDKYGEVPGIVYQTKDGVELPAELKNFWPRLAFQDTRTHFWQVSAPLPPSGAQKKLIATLRREYNAKISVRLT